jgi:hypothetical protein
MLVNPIEVARSLRHSTIDDDSNTGCHLPVTTYPDFIPHLHPLVICTDVLLRALSGG